MKQELKVLTSLNTNDNVIQYKWSEQDKQYVYLCFEFCPSNLEKEVNKKKLPSEEKVEIMRQISSGLEFLHTGDRKRKCTIQRDIKPSNIFLSCNDKWKIGDFSISKNLDPKKTDKKTYTLYEFGTLNYMPYESLRNLVGEEQRVHTPETDIFSLGILFFYVLTDGKNPFDKDKDPAFARIAIGQPPIFKELDTKYDYFTPLLAKMFNHEQDKRPNIYQVLAHPVFWSAKKKNPLPC